MDSNVDDGACLRRNMRNKVFFNPTTIPAHERGKPIIRMDLNECPYPPSPRAIAAMQAHADKLNRYPDGTCPQLTERLSAMTGVPAAQICWGSGSTQLLKSIMEMVIAPGDHLVSPSLLWLRFHGVYETLDADATMVPNLPDAHIDVDGLLSAVRNKTRLVVVLTPNNPTGLMLDADQIRKVCEQTPENVLLYIDEAYHEFAVHAGGADALEIVKARNGPWVVSRTFSKAFALAGARLGYAYCSSEELANALRLITSTFNISAFAEVGALAALDDTEYTKFIMDSNAAERQRLIEGLQELACKPLQSVTNFVAADTGAPGASVVRDMRARGIRIGRLADAGYENYVRISMGQPSDTTACLAALKAVLDNLRN